MPYAPYPLQNEPSLAAVPVSSLLLPNRLVLDNLSAHFQRSHSISFEPLPDDDDSNASAKELLYVLRLNGIDFGGWLMSSDNSVVLQPLVMTMTQFECDEHDEGEAEPTVLLGTCTFDPSATTTLLIQYRSVPLAALGLLGPLPTLDDAYE
jgi:hypothetical protein